MTSILRITTIDLQIKSHDPLYDVSAIMWTLIEMGLAIVCACIPQIRLFVIRGVSKIIPGLHSSEDMLAPLEPAVNNNSPTTGGGEDNWVIISRPDRVRLSTVCIGNASPRITLTPDDASAGMVIRRTIDYGFEVENKKDSPV